MMMKLMSKAVLLLCLSIFTTSTMLGQTEDKTNSQKVEEVSKSELTKFAKAYQKMQVANQEAQKEMISILESQDLEIKTFNEIHKAKLQNNKLEVSEKVATKYTAALGEIQNMQAGFQKTVLDIIKSEGLSVEKYEEISSALQTDKDLQQRLQKILIG
jgi:hypothetical protein